jgi:hypothetical protein
MRLEHLQNNTYQVLDDNTDSVLFQGSKEECEKYMLDKFLDKITNTPELLDVFKRLADK